MISRVRHHRRPCGFSLVELLLVLTIVTVLAVLAVASLQGTQSGLYLKGGGNAVIGEMDLARQTANTRNLPVDFRMYQVPDFSGSGAVYRVIALVIPASVSGAPADEYIGKPLVLPGDVVMVSDTPYSSLLNPTASATLAPAAGTESAAAPLPIRNQPYIKFTFLPSGALNLDSTVAWCLTLANQHKRAGTNGGPAANYIAIVMDCQSGRPSSFHP